MNKSKHKYYIVYEVEYNEDGSLYDIHNVYDSINLVNIAEWLGIRYNKTSYYTSTSTECINAQRLKESKYFIYKDYE